MGDQRSDIRDDLVDAWEAAFGGPDSPDKVDRLNQFLEYLAVNRADFVLDKVDHVHAIAQRLGYERGMAYSRGIKGYARYMLSDHERALPLLHEALATFEAIGDQQGRGMIMSALAGVQLSLGNFEKALTFGYEALTYFRSTGDRIQEAWCLHGFGLGYLEVGDYDLALRHFRECLVLFEQQEESAGIARALNGVGAAYQAMARYEEAHPYIERGLAVFRGTDNPTGISRALHDLATGCRHLGRLDEAMALYAESLALRERLGNRQSQSTTLIEMGRLYLQRGDPGEALRVLHRALDLAIEIKSRLRIYQAHEVLSAVYEAMGDLARALEHNKAFHEYREIVFSEAARGKLNTMKIGFEVEQARQETEIARLKNVELKEKNDRLSQLVDELRTTQAQLVQAEKLMSLGQLTAGIAHEIKNPLNFVNNFALLSGELLAELAGLLDAGGHKPVAEVRAGLEELLGDLRFNTAKILEHGQRADRIVHNMLEHSRGKPGVIQVTDLNLLLDEYVKLAYHGMRAQDAGFNVTLQRDYGEDVGRIEAVPQDVARVFLNLLNNAFYAVREKSRRAETPEPYEPIVRIVTTRRNEAVEIRIEDNGVGIPAALQPKIFEPFYTTKPPGEGTGLGLSLSYEIVTQGHGGQMRIESVEGAGAAFVVELPVAVPAVPADSVPRL